MLRTHVSGHARFAARLLGRGAFFGLLGLAVTIAVVSFLTACKCNEPIVLKDPIQPPREGREAPTPTEQPATTQPEKAAPPADAKANGN